MRIYHLVRILFYLPRTFGLFLILIPILLIASCAPRITYKVLDKGLNVRGGNPDTTLPVQGSFLGLKEYLTGKQAKVNVLMVPGLRDKNWSNYNVLIANITDELNFNFQGIEYAEIQPDTNDSMIGKGEVVVMRFTKNISKELNFYIANWTGVTRPVKDKLVKYEKNLYKENGIDNAQRGKKDPIVRTYLSNLVKNEYFIDIFSDLGLYRQKDYQSAIQKVVEETLIKIDKESNENSSLVCITGSMGSEILLDVLDKHPKSGNSHIQANLGGPLHVYPKQIFMLNNHLVFTSIMDLNRSELKSLMIETNSVVEEREKRKIIIDKIRDKFTSLSFSVNGLENKIIAFYDPNDVFAFAIPELFHADTSHIVNVPVSLTSQWTVDGKKLKDEFFMKFPIGDEKDHLLWLIREHARINAVVNLNAPGENAKYNKRVLSYIIYGHTHTVEKNGNGETENPSNVSLEGDISPYKIKPNHRIYFSRDTSKKKDKVGGIDQARILFKLASLGKSIELLHTDVPKTTYLSGMETTLKNNTSDNLYVLTVHGMADKLPIHFDYMAAELANRLGFIPVPIPNSDLFSEENNSEINFETTSSSFPYGIRKLVFQNSEGKSLIFVIVHWSPMSRPAKRQLHRMAIESQDALEQPTLISFINQRLKHEMIIDGFVDVTLAFGEGKFIDELSEAINRGMVIINTLKGKNKDPDKNVFLITGSLGSKILYNHISQTLMISDSIGVNDSLKQAKLTTRQVLEKTVRWYMLSNQIPMIGIKELDSVNRSKPFEDQVWHDIEKALNANPRIKEIIDLEVIAFHDPNDILTFYLPPTPTSLLDCFEVKNLPIRSAGGIEVNMKSTYKYLRKVDRHLIKLWVGDKEEFMNRKVNNLSQEIELLKDISDTLATFPDDSLVYVNKLIQDRLMNLEVKRQVALKHKKSQIFTPVFLDLYQQPTPEDPLPPTQRFMIRFDKAHDKTSHNSRILDIIAKGSYSYRRYK